MYKKSSNVEEGHIVHMIKIKQQETKNYKTNNKKDPVKHTCKLHYIPVKKGYI